MLMIRELQPQSTDLLPGEMKILSGDAWVAPWQWVLLVVLQVGETALEEGMLQGFLLWLNSCMIVSS